MPLKGKDATFMYVMLALCAGLVVLGLLYFPPSIRNQLFNKEKELVAICAGNIIYKWRDEYYLNNSANSVKITNLKEVCQERK